MRTLARLDCIDCVGGPPQCWAMGDGRVSCRTSARRVDRRSAVAICAQSSVTLLACCQHLRHGTAGRPSESNVRSTRMLPMCQRQFNACRTCRRTAQGGAIMLSCDWRHSRRRSRGQRDVRAPPHPRRAVAVREAGRVVDTSTRRWLRLGRLGSERAGGRLLSRPTEARPTPKDKP